MSKIIFKDAAHQALFEKQGFIVLPFLTTADLTELDYLFERMHPSVSADAGFVSGSYSSDFAYKQKASDEIVKVFSKHYERLFTDYQPFGAAFLYKMPNPNSQLSIHQDWTIVDEEVSVALNCWVPLTDMDAVNGTLHVVPATHYDRIKTLRAPTLPFFFSGNDDVVEQAAIPMYVRAGEAVILNQSVVHYSPPNRSEHIRKAITAGIKSKDAPMIFHYKDNSDSSSQIEKFSMHENFLISFGNFMEDISRRPKMGSSAGFIDFPQQTYGRDDLIKLIDRLKCEAGFGSADVKQTGSFFDRVSKFFTS
ncbi:unnamed protein product [Sphagnum balticum]